MSVIAFASLRVRRDAIDNAVDAALDASLEAPTPTCYSFSPMLFSVCIGSGVQLGCMVLLTLTFALFGFLSPANRGSLITASTHVICFCGRRGRPRRGARTNHLEARTGCSIPY